MDEKDISVYSEAILNTCGDYIERHPEAFINEAIKHYQLDKRSLAFDYAEVKDIESPKLYDIEVFTSHIRCSADIPYILDLWHKKSFLGAIFGKATFTVNLSEDVSRYLVEIACLNENLSHFDEYIE